jgi:putative protein-disulfide isomerase
MVQAEIIYFANPMCSWCWGFAPVVRQIRKTFEEKVRITLALGSLGDRSHPMGVDDKERVRHHWEHVIELTGQPFDFTFFDREGFVYDTEKPSRAVALVRSHYPALAVDFLQRLQELFYARNQDITDEDLLASAAGEFGVESDVFKEAYKESALAQFVEREWQEVAQVGVTGYPTLLAVGKGRPKVITIGCRPADQVMPEIAAYLEAPTASA